VSKLKHANKVLNAFLCILVISGCFCGRAQHHKAASWLSPTTSSSKSSIQPCPKAHCLAFFMISLAMHTPPRAGSREKRSSPAPSLPTPPDSAGKPLPPSSPARSSPSQSPSRLVELIGSIKRGYYPDRPWIKRRLEPVDFSRLREQLVENDLSGYFDDKIRLSLSSLHTISALLTRIAQIRLRS
jgi:hypothetical protein